MKKYEAIFIMDIRKVDDELGIISSASCSINVVVIKPIDFICP